MFKCDWQKPQSLVAQMVWLRNGEESAYNAGDPGSIPGLGTSPEKGMATTHSSILAWRIPTTEEPGRLQTINTFTFHYHFIIKYNLWVS